MSNSEAMQTLTLKNRYAIIETLNEAIRIEHALTLQSEHQAIVVRGLWRVQMAPFFQHLADEAREHARKFGTKVFALGGIPTFEVGPIRHSETVEEMVADALNLERAALDAYARALALVEDDVALRNMLEDHIDTEQRHVDELELLVSPSTGAGVETNPPVRRAS